MQKKKKNQNFRVRIGQKAEIFRKKIKREIAERASQSNHSPLASSLVIKVQG